MMVSQESVGTLFPPAGDLSSGEHRFSHLHYSRRLPKESNAQLVEVGCWDKFKLLV